MTRKFDDSSWIPTSALIANTPTLGHGSGRENDGAIGRDRQGQKELEPELYLLWSSVDR